MPLPDAPQWPTSNGWPAISNNWPKASDYLSAPVLPQDQMPALQPRPVGLGTAFTSGIGSGVRGIGSGIGSTVAAVGKGFGLPQGVQDWGNSFAQSQDQANEANHPELNTAPWAQGGGGWGAVPNWLAHGVGSALPGVAAAMGATAALPLVGVAATPLAASGAMTAAYAPQMAGSFYKADQAAHPEGTTQGQALAALGLSIPAAFVSSLAPGAYLGKGIAGQALERFMGGDIKSRVLAGAAANTALGAIGGGVQAAGEMAFRPDLDFPTKAKNIVDSTLSSAAIGGLLGGAFGVVHKAPEVPQGAPNAEIAAGVDTALGKEAPPPEAQPAQTPPAEAQPAAAAPVTPTPEAQPAAPEAQPAAAPQIDPLKAQLDRRNALMEAAKQGFYTANTPGDLTAWRQGLADSVTAQKPVDEAPPVAEAPVAPVDAAAAPAAHPVQALIDRIDAANGQVSAKVKQEAAEAGFYTKDPVTNRYRPSTIPEVDAKIEAVNKRLDDARALDAAKPDPEALAMAEHTAAHDLAGLEIVKKALTPPEPVPAEDLASLHNDVVQEGAKAPPAPVVDTSVGPVKVTDTSDPLVQNDTIHEALNGSLDQTDDQGIRQSVADHEAQKPPVAGLPLERTTPGAKASDVRRIDPNSTLGQEIAARAQAFNPAADAARKQTLTAPPVPPKAAEPAAPPASKVSAGIKALRAAQEVAKTFHPDLGLPKNVAEFSIRQLYSAAKSDHQFSMQTGNPLFRERMNAYNELIKAKGGQPYQTVRARLNEDPTAPRCVWQLGQPIARNHCRHTHATAKTTSAAIAAPAAEASRSTVTLPVRETQRLPAAFVSWVAGGPSGSRFCRSFCSVALLPSKGNY